MGKRRASEKIVKKEPSSSDTDEETNDDETLHPTDGPYTYPPDKMLSLIESFTSHLDSLALNQSSTVNHLEKIATEWVEKREETELVDVTLFVADFKRYFKTAMKIKNLEVADGSKILGKYLQSDKSLELFDDFPQVPPKIIQLYLKKKDLKMKFSEMANMFEKMKRESSEFQNNLQKEHVQLEKDYVEGLSNFLKNHPELTIAQRCAVEAKIKAMNKKFDKKDTTGRTPVKRVKKEPVTAYDIWASTKADKYRDLSEEERDRKMRKKFAKLDEGQRQLLEDLVLTKF